MKTLIISLTAILIFSVLPKEVFSQQKFGFVVCTHPDYKQFFLSGLMDLSKLDCNSISKNNMYGTQKSKVRIYSECLENSFKQLLKSKNIKSNGDFWVSIIDNDGYGCVYENEDACFMTKAKANQKRQADIAGYKRDGKIVEVVE